MKILINSDGNELEFKGCSGKTYFYLYTKSNTKLGQTLQIQEQHLAALLKANSIVEPKQQEQSVKKQEQPIKWMEPAAVVVIPVKKKAAPVIKQQSLF